MEESEVYLEETYTNSFELVDIQEQARESLKEVLLETNTEESLLDTYSNLVKESVTSAFDDFYSHYVINTLDSSFQVFQSFTYGEMAISFLLVLIIMIMLLKWFWEILR